MLHSKNKNSWIFFLGVAIFLACICFPVYAENFLTLSQAYELAKNNNLEFQALKKEAQSVEGDLLQAGLRPNPTLDIEQKSTSLSGFREGEKGLFLSQELETGGKRLGRLSVSQKALEESRFNVADKERQLRRQVRIQFYEAWISKQRLKILEEILENQDRFLKLSEARLELGAMPGLETKLIQAEYFRVQQKLEWAQQEVQVSMSKLMFLLGLSLDAKPLLQVPDNKMSSLPDLDSLLPVALEKRSDLKAQDKAIEKAEAQIHLEQAQRFPNFTVGVGLIWDKQFISGDAVSPAGVISEIRDQDRLFQFRLSVPLPFFNRHQGNILKAERLHESTLLREQNVKRTIQIELTTAWQKTAAMKRIIERYEKELLPTVKANLETVQKAYQLGGESILAVIQAQRTLWETQLDYLESLRALEDSLAALESATGVELP